MSESYKRCVGCNYSVLDKMPYGYTKFILWVANCVVKSRERRGKWWVV